MSADLLALLSEERFQCFNFHDPTLLDNAQVQTTIPPLEEIIKHFLQAIDHQQIVRPADDAFRRDLQAWTDSKLSKVYCEKERTHLVESTAIFIEYFYSSSTHEVKLLIGSLTAALIVVDDFASDPVLREQVRLFTYRYLRGHPQPEGACAALEDIMNASDIFYQNKDPQTASIAIIACLAFTDSAYLEARFVDQPPPQTASTHGRNTELGWCAEKFPYYLRSFTSIAGLYGAIAFTPSHEVEVPPTYWLPAADDMNRFISFTNDLLSFPKEIKNRESTNYIMLQTHIKHQAGWKSHFDSPDGLWTCRDTLYNMVLEQLASTKAVDELLVTCAKSTSRDFESQAKESAKGMPQEEGTALGNQRKEEEMLKLAAKLWQEFRQGYICGHLANPRYGLEAFTKQLRNSTELSN